MSPHGARALATLQRLTVPQLRGRSAEDFGASTNATNRTWLVKKIAGRLQALAEQVAARSPRHRPALTGPHTPSDLTGVSPPTTRPNACVWPRVRGGGGTPFFPPGRVASRNGSGKIAEKTAAPPV